MASDAQRDVMRFKHEKKLKDAELEQKERASKRQMATDIITSVTGNLVPSVKYDLGSSKSQGSKYVINAADWYKKWVDIKLFANIPEFNDITTTTNGMVNGLQESTGVLASEGLPLITFIKYIGRLGHSYHDRHVILNAVTAGNFTGANPALSKTLSQIGKVNSRSVSGSTEAIGYYFTLATDLATLLARLNTSLAMVNTFNPEMTQLREAYFKGITEEAGNTITKAFIKEKAQWKKVYSEYAARFNAEICIPADLTLLKRRIWLASTLLKDEHLNKGQIFGFSQVYYRGIDITNNKLTSSIDACLGTSLSRDFNDNWLFADIDNFRAYADHVFFELSKASTYKELVSNIRAAIKPANLAVLPEEPMAEPYVMGISDEVLSQIHNLEIPLGLQSASLAYRALSEVLTDGDQVYQTSTANIFQNVSTSSEQYYAGLAFDSSRDLFKSRFLSMYKSDCSPDDIIVATRLKPIWATTVRNIEGSNNKNIDLEIIACGTELPAYLYMIHTNRVKDLEGGREGQYNLVNYYNATPAINFVKYASRMSKFDWMPIVYAVDAMQFGSSKIEINGIGDVGNVFPITNEDLSRQHEAAVKSEFYTDPSIFVGFNSSGR